MDQANSPMKAQFLQALHEKRMVLLRFYSQEDGCIISRACAPMDFGPSRRAKDQSPRFHFWDFSSDTKNHTLSLKASQVASIELLPDAFDPAQFVSWAPRWIIPRDWGKYS